MRSRITALALALAATPVLHAQAAAPTATQALHLSAWAGATGTYTGLRGGRNLGITSGVDLGILSFYHFKPSVEIRGTYPIDGGGYVSEKSVLFGAKVERTIFSRYHPYVDFLYGRGALDYQRGGYPSLDGYYYYVQNPSNVLSPGVGVDFDLGHYFAAKADVQLQRWNTPVTASGHIYSKPLTIALIYRFDFNGHHKKIKPVVERPAQPAPPQPQRQDQAPPPPPADQPPPPPAQDQPAPPAQQPSALPPPQVP